MCYLQLQNEIKQMEFISVMMSTLKPWSDPHLFALTSHNSTKLIIKLLSGRQLQIVRLQITLERVRKTFLKLMMILTLICHSQF